MQDWSSRSWQQFSYQQAADYPDKEELAKVVDKLSLMPALVNTSEILQLREDIARAGRGEAFILQGGDCAESFQDCQAEIIHNKLKILLQMSQVLLEGMQKPIVRIGRIAGQYTKPRSSDFESINGLSLPSYRGDLVNQREFNEKARKPNPQLLLQGYHCAKRTLEFIRAHPAGGADFYSSHEALHLYYEQALTRQSTDGLWYNFSTHLPWIGMRTATLDSSHLEFLRGVENPIGIKIGPQVSPELLIELLAIANPHRLEGRILLISRMGEDRIEQQLPLLIESLQAANIPVTWSCDPMHGNTEFTADGIKTRHFDTILTELKKAFKIHQALGSHLGGVHFELTGENVTECIGGALGLAEEDLKKAYYSLVDPRLNYEQSLEMAMQLSLEGAALI